MTELQAGPYAAILQGVMKKLLTIVGRREVVADAGTQNLF